jgi:hypothetical protein
VGNLNDVMNQNLLLQWTAFSDPVGCGIEASFAQYYLVTRFEYMNWPNQENRDIDLEFVSGDKQTYKLERHDGNPSIQVIDLVPVVTNNVRITVRSKYTGMSNEGYGGRRIAYYGKEVSFCGAEKYLDEGVCVDKCPVGKGSDSQTTSEGTTYKYCYDSSRPEVGRTSVPVLSAWRSSKPEGSDKV